MISRRGPRRCSGDADVLVQLSRLVQGAFARIADRHDLTPVQEGCCASWPKAREA